MCVRAILFHSCIRCDLGYVIVVHIWFSLVLLIRNLPPQCLELFKWRQHAENHYIHIHHISKQRVCFVCASELLLLFFSVQLSVSLLSSAFCMILCFILLVTFIIIVACISIEKILRTKTALPLPLPCTTWLVVAKYYEWMPISIFFSAPSYSACPSVILFWWCQKKQNCHSVWFRCALSEITHHPENSKTNNMARTIKLSYATFEGTFGIFHNNLTRLTKLSWYLIAIQKKPQIHWRPCFAKCLLIWSLCWSRAHAVAPIVAI